MGASEWSSDETGAPASSSSQVEEAFRPTSGRLTGVAMVGLGALVAVLAVVDASNVDHWVGALGAVAALLGWTYLLRPRVRVGDGDLRLRNPFSDVRIPLAAIEELSVRQVLVVGVAGRRVTSPGLGRSRASLVKQPRAREDAPASETVAASYGEFAEDRLHHHMEAARARHGVRLYSEEQLALAAGLERRPAWPEIVALGLAVAATVLLAALG